MSTPTFHSPTDNWHELMRRRMREAEEARHITEQSLATEVQRLAVEQARISAANTLDREVIRRLGEQMATAYIPNTSFETSNITAIYAISREELQRQVEERANVIADEEKQRVRIEEVNKMVDKLSKYDLDELEILLAAVNEEVMERRRELQKDKQLHIPGLSS